MHIYKICLWNNKLHDHIDLDTHGYVPMNSEKWPHIIIVMDRCCLEKKKLNDLFVCVAADMSWVYEMYLTP